MQRLKLLYPFLFAIILVLSVVAGSPGYATLSDIGVVVGAMLVACGVLYALVVVGFRRLKPVVPLIVLFVLVSVYKFVPLILTARHIGGRGSEPALLLIPVAATVAVSWWLTRRPLILDRINVFLTITGALLLVWLGVRVLVNQVRARAAIQNSALAKELARPVPVKPGTAAASQLPLRDIYLIVLDEYANSSVLRERFDFDNRVFEDSLRQLGFTIPRMVRSNYAHTTLSLPSLLNFSHVDRLTQELGPRGKDPTLPNYLLENNRTVAFLQARGYKFLFFPSQWWPSTRHNRHADVEFQAWHGLSLGRELTRTHFRRSLYGGTAFSKVLPGNAPDVDHVRRTLAALEQVPASAEPTFVFAHIINPHHPYVFEPDCRTVPMGTSRKKRVAYIDQLQCLNHLMLGLVTVLIQRSSVPPIILIQGDHGTSLLNFSWAPSAAAVSPAQARERFGAFGAYYLPAGGGRLFKDSVTVVNVFRKVLGYYFDADIPLAPDKLFMSREEQPFSFNEVQPSSLSQPAP